MSLCTPDFHRLASEVGGLPCSRYPVVAFHDPFRLDNWTMPVVELMLVAGAIACLVHALRRRRRHGDPTNLVVWGSGVVSLLAIEPIMYFPQWFGLDRQLGLTFVHNQFSVQFFYDRLPLYIVAMYPVFGYVAYALVQQAGIFERFPLWVGSVTTAFTFLVLYEVVDMVGPQLGWWVWNTQAPQAKPAFTFLPLFSLQAFSLSIPAATAWVAQRTRRVAEAGSRGVAAAIGLELLACWPFVMLASVPGAVLRAVGVPKDDAIALAVATFLAAAVLVGTTTYLRALRPPSEPVAAAAVAVESARTSRFLAVAVTVYLATAASFWVYALPAYRDAVAGVTAQGHPIGSLPAAAASFVLAVLVTIASYVASHRGLRPGALDQRALTTV